MYVDVVSVYRHDGGSIGRGDANEIKVLIVFIIRATVANTLTMPSGPVLCTTALQQLPISFALQNQTE